MPVQSVPSLLRFLSDKCKKEACRWRSETEKRCDKTNSSVFTFPPIPYPIKEDGDHVQNLHPRVLQLSKAFWSLETQNKWEGIMHELSVAAETDGWTNVPPHYQIKNLHERKSIHIRKDVLQLLQRTCITNVIMPSTLCA